MVQLDQSGTTASSSRWTTRLSGMALGPCNDVRSFPDPAYGQHCFRLWEIGMCVKQLMNTLVRDTENLSHFRHAHKILCHIGNLANG